MSEEENHAKRTMGTWKRISLFIAAPVVGYLTWKNLIVGEDEHEEHEYIPWAHLRIRNKPFPWGDGDKTLFHNPHTNPCPPGEESNEPPSTEERVNPLTKFITNYLLPDREEEDRIREEHLQKMQKQKERFLARKERLLTEPVPIQPMDVVREMNIRSAERRIHSGLD